MSDTDKPSLPASPPPTSGGSPLGIHFLSDFSSCETRWYWRNLALWPGARLERTSPEARERDNSERASISGGVSISPAPTEGLPIGITPARFKPALDTGSRVHAGIAAFYQSGCRDGEDTGERSLDAMLDAARQDPPIDPLTVSEDIVESLALTDRLLTKYFEVYQHDDGVRVAFDDEGHPLIEREFWLDLGYRGYRFTCRADLVYWAQGQYLRFMEHKTCRASDMPKWLKRADIDPQFSGQFLMGLSHFGPKFDAVTLNAIVKDRARRSDLPELMRKDYARSPAHLEKFRLDLVRRLQRIDEKYEEWQGLVAKGMEPDDAAKIVFDGSPSGYECVGMGVACDYLSLCVNRERLSGLLIDNFEPRHYKYAWENPLRRKMEDTQK